MTAEEIRDWQKSPVTQEFFELVKLLHDDLNKMTHDSLAANELQNAALCNAGMAQCQEVLGIPAQMMEDSKDAS